MFKYIKKIVLHATEMLRTVRIMKNLKLVMTQLFNVKSIT